MINGAGRPPAVHRGSSTLTPAKALINMINVINMINIIIVINDK